MVWSKAMATVHQAMGSQVDPSKGRVTVRVHGRLEFGIVNVKGVVWGV